MKHEITKQDLSKKDAESVQELYSQNEAQLEEYISQLIWWNDRINLVSRDVPRETIRQHVEHSLSISLADTFQEASFLVDAGTGGGLPGLPLAVCFGEKKYLLNDIVTKKIMAVKQIVKGVNLSSVVEMESSSIEEADIREEALIISKHAFKINELWRMIMDKPWKGLIMLKGAKEVEGELEGIEEPLRISIVDLKPGFEDSFYDGKALVNIQRIK